ncbi:hypothetical protein Y032_0023g692 [Ancylostoma ceylanicum]|nr:hypothetical protein Y032_0023g692 [Ancylostoma ceylanicum]
MKYGKQQMMLIRKRMKIENWIDAEVAKLFNGNDNNGVDIDVDVLLDLDSVPAKRKFVFVSQSSIDYSSYRYGGASIDYRSNHRSAP